MSEPLSNQNWPDNERIIRKMEEEINANLGKDVWDELTGNDAPASNMNNTELCRTTGLLLSGFDKRADSAMANQVFSQVRHGLTHADFAWARKKFLQYEDIDLFAEALLKEQLNELKDHMQRGAAFYGQPITPEVLAFVSGIEDLFYGKRTGNKIHATAIPFCAQEYLHAADDNRKRYHMCHCQFARESILSDSPVSKTMCYCSLGHNLMFWETVLDTQLKGDVTSSALGGDLSCKFEIFLTDEVMKKYVHIRHES